MTVLAQAGYEVRLFLQAARRPRACLLSWSMLLAGLFYLVGPIDLIPGRTPYVGHLDEAGFLLGGLALARTFLPDTLRHRAQAAQSSRPASEDLRRYALQGVAALFSAPILRLCLGRWPDRPEIRSFTTGFISGEAVVPPLLRGLHLVPAAKEPLGNLAVLNLVREGVVRKPNDLGFVAIPMPPAPGNPLSYWRGRPFSFLHFEKAAGISLASLLTGLLHPVQIDDDPERGTAPHLVSAFAHVHTAELRRKLFVWGHYDLAALRRLDPARMVITVLRRPRDRILSLYQFWRSVDPRLVEGGFVNFNVAAAHRLDLLSFLRSADPLIRNYIDNVYVRRLTGLYLLPNEPDELHRAPALHLDRALAELARLEFVGVAERIDASLPLLGRLIGADLPAHLPRRNTSEQARSGQLHGFRRIDRSELSPSVEAELAHLTRLDDVVYQSALDRLQADRPS